MGNVAHSINTSVWELRQGRDMPLDSICGVIPGLGHVWHVLNNRSGYCDYHHRGGLKAPAARVLANRRRAEGARRSAPAELSAPGREGQPS